MRKYIVLFVFVASLALVLAETDEERKARLRQELSEAHKRLFWREKPIEPAEALELLKTLAAEYGDDAPPGVQDTPIDLQKLIDFADVNEDKCQQAGKVLSMRREFDLAKDRYPALLPFITEHFRDQFELCGFHTKYKDIYKMFKERHSFLYGKMNAFKDRLGKFGKVRKNWKGNQIHNPVQYNEAMYDLYEDKKKETPTGGKNRQHRVDAAWNAYKEMHAVLDGANLFNNEVAPNMDLARYHPDADKDKELKENWRDKNVYHETYHNNYEPAMSEMFADAHYDEGDKTWKAYQQWASNWV